MDFKGFNVDYVSPFIREMEDKIKVLREGDVGFEDRVKIRKMLLRGKKLMGSNEAMKQYEGISLFAFVVGWLYELTPREISAGILLGVATIAKEGGGQK